MQLKRTQYPIKVKRLVSLEKENNKMQLHISPNRKKERKKRK